MTDLNPLAWNWNQWKASGKHIASYAAGGVSMAVALHFISPSQGGDLTQNISLISDGLMNVAKGVAGLAGILIPVYTAFRAAHNASPSSQVSSVVESLSAPRTTQAANAVADPASRTKLIEAVAEMPEVKKIIPVDPAIAAAIPSPKVTAS